LVLEQANDLILLLYFRTMLEGYMTEDVVRIPNLGNFQN
jgi:hypothetical protein